MHVKFRTIVDLSWATVGHFLMVGSAVYDPENGIYLSAFGFLLNCVIFLILHLVYFRNVLATQDPTSTPKGKFNFENITFSFVFNLWLAARAMFRLFRQILAWNNSKVVGACLKLLDHKLRI